MAFLNAVRWVKHVRGTQQINDSHPHALAYEIDSHELENASHFAMRISLFSSLQCGSIFIRVAVVAAQKCEVLQNSAKI